MFRTGTLFIIASFLEFVFCFGISAGADIHVPGTYSTIQQAVDASADGDTVWIADGTYTGDGNNDLNFNGKAITVRSENGPENCIIECQTGKAGFLFGSEEQKTSVVSGLTIKNGVFGIACSNASPTITDCIVTNNETGINCVGSSPAIINCDITGNTNTMSGGGISFQNCFSPEIINCTITDNITEWGEGGGIYCYRSSPVIINSTIANNQAFDGGGIFLKESYPVITNSILWNNTSGEIYVESGNATVTYCNIKDGYDGENNINDNPLYDAAFRLKQNSPCIDKGNSNAANIPSTDKDGNIRIVRTVDMGAYEFFLKGDINLDYLVDISDAILVLQVLCAVRPPLVSMSADVDRDGQISLQEAIYIIGKAAGSAITY
ncbi:MAG: hypothetical protein GY749_04435 [Desulfobacteraceae bacterium]|nr:hypothetical protein [Desulfobacteraceae bacterium]